MASRTVLFDTSVIIDHVRTNRHEERLEAFSGIIVQSSVVLSELLRGTTKKSERDFVARLASGFRLLTPTDENWLESGEILSEMYRRERFSPEKLRDLHFDVLIALSARDNGATVITSNRVDFERIRTLNYVDLEIW